MFGTLTFIDSVDVGSSYHMNKCVVILLTHIYLTHIHLRIQFFIRTFYLFLSDKNTSILYQNIYFIYSSWLTEVKFNARRIEPTH